MGTAPERKKRKGSFRLGNEPALGRRGGRDPWPEMLQYQGPWGFPENCGADPEVLAVCRLRLLVPPPSVSQRLRDSRVSSPRPSRGCNPGLCGPRYQPLHDVYNLGRGGCSSGPGGREGLTNHPAQQSRSRGWAQSPKKTNYVIKVTHKGREPRALDT